MNAITLTFTSATLRLRRAFFVGAALLGLGLGLGACDSKSLGEESCKPGETKEIECNTCSCEGGQWACTQKACGGYEPCLGKDCGDACTVCDPNDPDCFETQVLKACDSMGQCVTESPDLLMCEGGGTGGECIDGEMKMVDCNTCSCMGGYWACSEIGCEGYEPCLGKACGDACTLCDPADPDCVEDQVTKACNSEGVCEPGTPGVCAPACMDGETKKIDCNTCTCEGGMWGCTEIGCWDGCAGKACGDSCSNCDPQDPDCPIPDQAMACDPNKVCVVEVPNLCEGAYVPCEGKVCGEACTICDPNDPECVEDQVIKACNIVSECVPDTGDLCL